MGTPFIGYMILYHTKIEGYLGGLGGFLEQQTVPGQCVPWIGFSMRLNLLYCGLLLLGIGTIAYRVFAPEVIKNSRNISEYVVGAVDNVSARELRSMYATIQSLRPEMELSFMHRAPWLGQNKSLKAAADALKRDDDGQIKMDVLRSFYDVQNGQAARLAIYFVLLFYALGFLLLAIPGLSFTRRVLCVVMHDTGVL